MKPDSNKTLQAPLSLSIVTEYRKLIDVINNFPEQLFYEKKFSGTGGLVSVADVIAYQIGWGKLLLNWYEGGITNTPCIMPGEGFNTWDYTNIALHFYNQYAKLSPDELKKEFDHVVQKIISMTEKEARLSRLEKEGVWKWCTLQSGKQWPLSKWITVNTVAPYKRAGKLLKKQNM